MPLLPRGHPVSWCCWAWASSSATRGHASMGGTVPNHPGHGSATVSGVRPANPGGDRLALGTGIRGRGQDPRGRRWCPCAVVGDWLEMGQGNGGWGAKQGYFLSLAGLPRASGTSAHSRRFGSETGMSGSSRHQVLRRFTPGNYQQLLQC